MFLQEISYSPIQQYLQFIHDLNKCKLIHFDFYLCVSLLWEEMKYEMRSNQVRSEQPSSAQISLLFFPPHTVLCHNSWLKQCHFVLFFIFQTTFLAPFHHGLNLFQSNFDHYQHGNTFLISKFGLPCSCIYSSGLRPLEPTSEIKKHNG